MSKEVAKLEKKLQSLYTLKAKEEAKNADIVAKTQAKYKEDCEKMKEAFETKLANQKADHEAKMGEILPEISFYEQKKAQIEKLEAQIANLDTSVDERMGRN